VIDESSVATRPTLLDYLITPVFLLCLGSILCLFHVLQVLARPFSVRLQEHMYDWLCGALLLNLKWVAGARFDVQVPDSLPTHAPLVFVSNHQSMFDIPAVVWGFRKCYPRFISKISLAKNLPSISHNLKHGKSALIDRENGTQSVKEILKLEKLIQSTNQAACIFPEGKRSKTGKVKKFMTAGVNTLLRAAPSAVIVPFVIDGHSQFMAKGAFPLRFGQKINYTVLDPVEPKGRDIEELLSQIQLSIKKALNQES